LFSLGNHECNVIADITHLSDCENRMRPDLHGRTILGMDHPPADEPADLVLSDVIAGQHCNNPILLRPFRRLDRADLGVRMGTAHEISIDLILEVDVVGITTSTGDEAVILLALYAGADSCLAHDLPPVTLSRLHVRGAGLDSLDDIVIA